MTHYFIQDIYPPHEWIEIESHYKDENPSTYVLEVFIGEDESYEEVLARLNCKVPQG